jgi:hypothetical protein
MALITVATLKFGELPYFRYSEAINRRYCEQHGYRFEIIQAPRQIERSPVWFKVKGVADLLHSSTFVLFMDADAYFVDESKSIRQLITEQMGTSSLLIATDEANDSWANVGVFLVRHSEQGFKILDDWWNAPFHQETKWLWRFPPEQGAFNSVVRPQWEPQHIKVIACTEMNGTDGMFIRHLLGLNNYDRLRILRDEVGRLRAR